jgi:cytochrome c-type biogenesis protein CcmH/NrfF
MIMRRRSALLAVMIALVSSVAARAAEPDEVLADPALEARARHLSTGLRCLVCQNQSIDDSNAPLARDLRVIVRERLVAGDTDQQVMTYVVARYGDYVLLKPPLNLATLILWATPAVLLLLAFLIIFRRGPTRAVPAPLSTSEEQRLAGLLGKDKDGA